MQFNDSLLQVFILIIWSVGFMLSPLDNWRSKIYAVLGAVAYMAYTLRLYMELGQGAVTIFNFGSDQTYFLSGVLKVDPLGMLFIIINAITLLMVVLKKQSSAEINYKRYYFQTFLIAGTVNITLMVAQISSFVILLELIFFQYILLLKLNGRRKLEVSLKNAFPVFALSFFLAFVSLVLMELVRIQGVPVEMGGGQRNHLNQVAIILLIISFGMKAGVFPFHGWIVRSMKYGSSRSNMVLLGSIGRLGLLGILKFLLIDFTLEITAISKYLLVVGVSGVLFFTIKMRLSRLWSVKQGYYYCLGAAIFMIVLSLPNRATVIGAVLFILIATVLSLGLNLMSMHPKIEEEQTSEKMAMGYIVALYGVPFLGLFTGELLIIYGLANKNAFVCVGVALLLCFYNLNMITYLYNSYFIKKRTMLGDKSEVFGLVLISAILVVVGTMPQVVLNNLVEIINFIPSR